MILKIGVVSIATSFRSKPAGRPRQSHLSARRCASQSKGRSSLEPVSRLRSRHRPAQEARRGASGSLQAAKPRQVFRRPRNVGAHDHQHQARTRSRQSRLLDRRRHSRQRDPGHRSRALHRLVPARIVRPVATGDPAARRARVLSHADDEPRFSRRPHVQTQHDAFAALRPAPGR